MTGKRTDTLAQIRAAEERLDVLALRLQRLALQDSERGRELRAAAGRAGWLGRKVRLWMAARLEARAAARFKILIDQRRMAKIDEAPQGGHRSARRRLDRESI